MPSPINVTGVDDVHPAISSDDLTLVIASARSGGSGNRDLWASTRPDDATAWSTITNLTQLNTKQDEDEPELSDNGLELFFQRDFSSIFVAARASTSDAWGVPVLLGPEVNVPNRHSSSPVLTSDGLTMFFSSDLDGSEWEMDIYMTSRADLTSPWGAATRLGAEINTPGTEWASDVAADGNLYFLRANALDAWSSYEIWRVPITPVPEPRALTLASLGLVSLGLLLARRRL